MAKDVYHQIVKEALQADGWIVTNDPLTISDKSINLDYEIDLGAERLLEAEKGTEKIAVEVKSFLRTSLVNEFHTIFGQYLIYKEALLQIEPTRVLYLAIPLSASHRLGDYPFLLGLIEQYKLHVVIFDEKNKTIVLWKK